MTINQTDHFADNRRRQNLMAAGGLLGALAASSCCIFPLVLFGLGVTGAWIGNFTQLAAYQPFFIGANRVVKTSLIVATILVVAALGLDFIALYFLNP